MSEAAHTTAVVLAAGKGTRMKSELPKVVIPLANKPLILHVLDELQSAGVKRTIVVVGYKKEVVMHTVNGRSGIEFCEQKEQLGTGHAVLVCRNLLKDFTGTILVACGDAPMIRAETFASLIDLHKTKGFAATVLSANRDDPYGYGRIVRNLDGSVQKIVEEKDATPEEKAIREVNTGTYCFESRYLWDGLASIGNDNAQKEYYLPDLIQIFRSWNLPVGAKTLLSSVESYAINSPEDLELLNNLLHTGAGQK